MRLSELKPGTPFEVSRVMVGGEIGKRLADMGFTDGAAGLLVRGAFLRGPIQVRIRGYDLLIRRGEAKLIEVAMEGAGGADSAGAAGAADSVGAAGAAEDSGALAGAAGAARSGRENEATDRPYRARRGRGGLFRSLFAEPDCCGGASHDPNDRKSA